MIRFNANKLFRRLSIRAKLLIAFAILGVGPLTTFIVSGMAIGGSLLHEEVRRDLTTGVELARLGTLRSMSDIDAHVRYMTEYVARPMLLGGDVGPAEAGELMGGFLLADSSALFSASVLDQHGDVLLQAGRDGSWSVAPEEGRQLLYLLEIRGLARGTRALRPVELRGERSDELIPAIAVLSGVYDSAGTLVGGVVGEALASTLFLALEGGEGALDGEAVAGLADREGLYLYHSERKNDWQSLMDPTAGAELAADFSPREVERIMAGDPTVMTTDDGRLVASAPLVLEDGGDPQFFLFRSVPRSVVFAPFRGFLILSVLGGLMLLLLVSGAAVLAAQQFTQPIYRLRGAARQLMSSGHYERFAIGTNDELEDLARDFERMADAIIAQRDRLEELLDDQRAELQRHQAELAEILSNSADAIVGLDSKGEVRVWNQGAESLFGYSAPEAEGRLVDDLIGSNGMGGVRERDFIRRELARTGRLVNFRTERRNRDGELIPVTLTQTRLSGNDGAGESLIIRDARLEASLEEQMGRSERLAAISVMAAGLAHEVNNPLGIIGNRIELMRREVNQGRADRDGLRSDLDLLQEHVDRLRKLTGDLLRFARDDEQDASLLSLDSVVQRVVGLLERTVVSRKVLLEGRPSPTGIPPILGTESAIETLLVNLVMNAADASEEGGHIWVETRVSPTGNTVELEVRDTAGGIPPDLGARIWEPFFTTKGASGGTGLGLAVCRSIMDRHNGRIWAENSGDGGSRFIAAFPVPAAEQIA